MSTAYEIPLIPASQKFQITLGGTQYNVTARWNSIAQIWVVDFYSLAGTLVLGGLQLVAGVDLFDQYAYLDFGGLLIAECDFDVNTPPNLTNLGSTGHLFFVTP